MADAVQEAVEPVWAVRMREASRRERSATARDDAARERDEDAWRRDMDAYRRDRAAAERDRLARLRDRVAIRRGDPPACVADRLVAAEERASAALDRLRSHDDRRDAALDRHMASLDRWQSSLDRLQSADDRRTGAAERARLAVDDLTGLLRRSTGLSRLQGEVDRARRGEATVTVAFVDVDGLKKVNDSDGHQAGDVLLRRVAKALRDCMRSYDVVMRWGGDEFVCGMLGVPEEVASARFAEVAAELTPMHASVTVGIAELRSDESAVALVQRADAELVERRRSGIRVSGEVQPRRLTVRGDAG